MHHIPTPSPTSTTRMLHSLSIPTPIPLEQTIQTTTARQTRAQPRKQAPTSTALLLLLIHALRRGTLLVVHGLLLLLAVALLVLSLLWWVALLLLAVVVVLRGRALVVVRLHAAGRGAGVVVRGRGRLGVLGRGALVVLLLD